MHKINPERKAASKKPRKLRPRARSNSRAPRKQLRLRGNSPLDRNLLQPELREGPLSQPYANRTFKQKNRSNKELTFLTSKQADSRRLRPRLPLSALAKARTKGAKAHLQHPHHPIRAALKSLLLLNLHLHHGVRSSGGKQERQTTKPIPSRSEESKSHTPDMDQSPSKDQPRERTKEQSNEPPKQSEPRGDRTAEDRTNDRATHSENQRESKREQPADSQRSPEPRRWLEEKQSERTNPDHDKGEKQESKKPKKEEPQSEQPR